MNPRGRSQAGTPVRAPVPLPPSRTVAVRGADGTHLHTQVFGPADGYPIVLAHGIVCAIPVWAYQIADLARDYRVIAFDHRGHGQSGVPRRDAYSLDHLAADLDAVLEATVAPHERAVLVGHSMGGMAVAAWSERYRHKVQQRAGAVALLNTTTGDLLREINLFPVPRQLSHARVRAARSLISAFGGLAVPDVVRQLSREFVEFLAVGAHADPSMGAFIYELFATTSPAGRGGCAKALADAMGRRHISLAGMTVPTLVIGSHRDRLTPISQSRKMARSAPHLVDLVELPGGHCAMLEQRHEVNRQLRALARSVSGAVGPQRISS